mmetsp:Transcript_60886/g.181417  ORF Transcript_60886/g.181417 Transcript_60886/m.181417 type:complete len:283 (-) Transcript_60886:232-1080(-)
MVTSHPLTSAKSRVRVSRGNSVAESSTARAVRPVPSTMTRSNVDTVAISSQMPSSTTSAHLSNSGLPAGGGSNFSSEDCSVCASMLLRGSGELRTRRPLLKSTAPRFFPRVHTSTTCLPQRDLSALLPQTSSLYPAASVCTTVWQKLALPRSILEITGPMPASRADRSSPSTPSCLETSLVTEHPTTPFQLKWSTSCRRVLLTVLVLAAGSPPRSNRMRNGSSSKEPSSIDTGAARAAEARSSMPSDFVRGRSAMERRMPQPSAGPERDGVYGPPRPPRSPG